MKERGRQLGEQIRRAMSAILLTEINDPRVKRVTVTGVHVTGDMGLARIYWTSEASPEDRARIAKGLAAAVGFVRLSLGKKIRLRIMPKIEFFFDESLDEMARIESLFSNLVRGNDSLEDSLLPPDNPRSQTGEARSSIAPHSKKKD